MSELKAFNCVESDLQEFCEPRLVYLKSEADKVIAELEQRLALAHQTLRLNKPEALYSDLETMGRLSHEIMELKQKSTIAQHTLWLARAYRSHAEQHWTAYLEYVHFHEKSSYEFDGDDIVHRSNKNYDSFREWCKRWASVERKCRIKAKEFK